jgi:diacylglycerol kinase
MKPKKIFNPLNKAKVVNQGFWQAFFSDFSVTYKVVITFITIILSLIFHETVNVIIILIVSGSIISLELINSAIEDLADFVKDEYDEKIKKVKDVSAAGVGFSTLIWIIVIIWEYYEIINRIL